MTENIIIIDYGSGNLRSAEKAFAHVIQDQGLNAAARISPHAEDVLKADRIVLPGQGAFGDCMQGLENTPGMREALEKRVLKDGVPFFGICVGMQLLVAQGLEHGVHEGLGWIEGQCVPLVPKDVELKIPHMGWNIVQSTQAGEAHFMLQGITKSSGNLPPHFYFVHSFMVECKDKDHVLGYADYGGEVSAIIGRDNIFGTQFHPEKSQKAGLKLIENFLRWRP